MLERLASFVYRNNRRVLVVALVGVGVAGVLGLGVAKRLSPYGDTDPSTQSVQATNRYRGGLASYLEVTVAQNAALTNQRTAAGILTRRMNASVLLMKGLGGGWQLSSLPAN